MEWGRPIRPAWAQDTGPALPALTMFWRQGCLHCENEKEFLGQLRREMPRLEPRLLDLAEPAQQALFDDLCQRLHLPRVTPITLVGSQVVVGFDAAHTTGAEIRRLLASEPPGSSLEDVLASPPAPPSGQELSCPVGPSTPCEALPREFMMIEVPLIGAVDLAKLTLPMLSLVLGLVDGFNPCAMWVLVAFLTALLQAGDLRRMALLAGIFILAEAVMYFAILNSWFLAFDFIKADRIVTPLVGVVALGGGVFFLWEARRSDLTCQVQSGTQRGRTLSRLQRLATGGLTPAVFLGILALAFSVNVVEFACSIGIPQTYTKILDMNRVGLLERELLMAIYIFFYMLDDLVVFGLALGGAQVIGLTGRYARLSSFVGGIILLVLGSLLLFAPEKLRF
jgi:hypothetical protein